VNNMKKQLTAILVVGAVLSAMTSRGALSLNLNSFPGAMIQFDSGASPSFEFTTSTTYSGQDCSSQPKPADIVRLVSRGSFSVTGGKWYYGPITVNGLQQSAPVTTASGTLTIHDGHGSDLTGTLNWGNDRDDRRLRRHQCRPDYKPAQPLL